MTKDHARKNRARAEQRKSGARYTSAESGSVHDHPRPDLSILTGLPYGSAERPVDLDLATRLIGACRDGCRPCQDSLIARITEGDRVTLAALAGAVYGLLPTAGPFAASATREWHPHARRAHETGDAAAALAALDALPADYAAAVLDDALDHWAAGGLSPDQIRIVDLSEELEAEMEKAAGDVAAYAVSPQIIGADTMMAPALIFEPETAAAEREDLAAQTGWPAWTLAGFPAERDNWRLRVDIATRSLREIARIDADGFDDLTLWEADEAVTMPAEWWDLLDRAQRVILCGPCAPEPDALESAASAGKLSGVIARVSFW